MNKKIIQALSSLGVPVAFMEYSGSANAYILFQVMSEQETEFFDDMNNAELHYININFWYKNPADKAKEKQIKQLMKQAGFTYDGGGADLKDGDYYGKGFDFIFKEYI